MNEKRRAMPGAPLQQGGAPFLLLPRCGPFQVSGDDGAPGAENDADPNRNTAATAGSIMHQGRSILDNFIIEFVASLFVHVSLALFWNADDELRFAPAATLGLVMLCLKDEDLFFPDASPTVTFLLYALGGYKWPHLLARLMGQLCALGASIWFCTAAVLPPLAFRVEQPMGVVFFSEALASALEHLAVVYMVLPMLPIAQRSACDGLRFLFYRSRSKRDSTVPPPMASVVNAALVITILHYILQRGLCAEVNPFATIMLAMAMRLQQEEKGIVGAGHEKKGSVWAHAGIAVWGQVVGVGITAAYLIAFAPRLPRYRG